MSKFQVVEKGTFGTDWELVRYQDRAMARFDNEADAMKAAIGYLTSVNVDNALAKSEKQAASECFMVTPEGILLGVLDGELWYFTDGKGNLITDPKHYLIQDKNEVAVRKLPGT